MMKKYAIVVMLLFVSHSAFANFTHWLGTVFNTLESPSVVVNKTGCPVDIYYRASLKIPFLVKGEILTD